MRAILDQYKWVLLERQVVTGYLWSLVVVLSIWCVPGCACEAASRAASAVRHPGYATGGAAAPSGVAVTKIESAPQACNFRSCWPERKCTHVAGASAAPAAARALAGGTTSGTGTATATDTAATATGASSCSSVASCRGRRAFIALRTGSDVHGATHSDVHGARAYGPGAALDHCHWHWHWRRARCFKLGAPSVRVRVIS